jgi:hypothetical protein
VGDGANNRQVGRQAGRQASRQADRRADRQTDTHSQPLAAKDATAMCGLDLRVPKHENAQGTFKVHLGRTLIERHISRPRQKRRTASGKAAQLQSQPVSQPASQPRLSIPRCLSAQDAVKFSAQDLGKRTVSLLHIKV